MATLKSGQLSVGTTTPVKVCDVPGGARYTLVVTASGGPGPVVFGTSSTMTSGYTPPASGVIGVGVGEDDGSEIWALCLGAGSTSVQWNLYEGA